MNNRKRLIPRLSAIIMALIMVFSCTAMTFAASNESVSKASALKLGKKTTIKFKKSTYYKERYYKIKIPKKGAYKVYIYSDRKNSNDDFWVGLYASASDAKKGKNLIYCENGTINNDSSKTDYQLFKLNEGTYYFCVQCFHKKYLTTGLKVKRMTNTYDWNYRGSSIYKYQVSGINVSDIYDRTGTVYNVKSSNPKVLKVNKDTYKNSKGKTVKNFEVQGMKPGKAKVTIEYKTPKGKKCTITRKMTVKKYPNSIKSLKVNGKAVSISKNRFNHYATSDATTAKIKLALKTGWKVEFASIYLYNWNTGANKEVKGAVKKVKKGTSFSFPKDYTAVSVYMRLKKGSQYMDYSIYISRPSN